MVLDEFDIPSEVGNERGAMERVELAVRGLRIDQRRLDNLKTAVAEATMNAMEHGNEYRRDRPVTLRVLYAPDALRVQVTDRGQTVARPESEPPDIEKKLAGEQRPRGWGLFLIENLVDEARVTNVGGTHTLELVLKLGGDSANS